jgi:TM2 domain-containing membrane protein YozV
MENTAYKLGKFLSWWNAPNTKKDRYIAATVGAFGGFWIGGLGRIILGALPVSITDVGLWALGGVVVFSLLGAVFPKVITCVCYPLSIFGVGN